MRKHLVERDIPDITTWSAEQLRAAEP